MCMRGGQAIVTLSSIGTLTRGSLDDGDPWWMVYKSYPRMTLNVNIIPTSDSHEDQGFSMAVLDNPLNF